MPPTDDAAGSADGHPFPTVFGRGLVGELPNIVHPPYLVVTMADLWPMFEPALAGHDLAGVHLVESIEVDRLESLLDSGLDAVPAASSVIGLGGGQAIDVAKYFSWRRRLPLFQVPTAMTVNAPWGHRAGLRTAAGVRYLGWAVPEAVYVDIDVIQAAPPALNRSGVGDVLCYHTAHYDWRLAHELGKVEGRWPYDERLVAAARLRLDAVLARLDDIRDVTEEGIRTLTLAHRWGGATFHDPGGTPGTSKASTTSSSTTSSGSPARHFIHGQPVGLGIYIGSVLAGQPRRRHARRPAPCRRRHPARGDGRHLGRRRRGVRTLPRTSATPACGSASPTAVPVDGSSSTGRAIRIEAVYGPWEGGSMRPARRSRRAATASTSGSTRRPPGSGRSMVRRSRGGRVRLALGVRPLPGRPAAGGGDRVRPASRARGDGDGHLAGAARHLVLSAAYRNAALTAKMISTIDVVSGGRADARHRRRLEARRVAGLRLRVPRRGDPARASCADHLEIITRMLGPGRATYDGTYAHVRRRDPRAEGSAAAADPDHGRWQRARR